MAKMRFWFSLGYKLVVCLISGIALVVQFHTFGLNAWRLLETGLLIAAVVYFAIAVLAEWFRRKRLMPHTSVCAFLQGFIIVTGISLGMMRIFYQVNHLEWLGARGVWCYIQLFCIPLLAIGDWLFFTKKGGWAPVYPWYWLGIIISYLCVIFLTADAVPSQGSWNYPYYFLNYSEWGIDLLLWMSLIVVIMLALGYLLTFLDSIISGKLGKHIVMPKIKTIIIEEDPEDLPVVEPEIITPKEVNKLKKSAKVVPTKSSVKSVSKSKKQPNVDVIKPVEGLKDRKSAQRIHRAGKSKSEIIADIRLQMTSNKNSKSRPRPNSSKTSKKS